MSHLDDHPDEVKNAAYYRREIVKLREELGSGTTGLKYKAELYDEVWSSAKSVGFANVTDALTELAKLKAASEQEPIRSSAYDSVDRFLRNNLDDDTYAEYSQYLETIYAAPIPPVDVQLKELFSDAERQDLNRHREWVLEDRKKIAELERKLAEYVAAHRLQSSAIDKAREEGRLSAVPEGWQVVPKKPTAAMRDAGNVYTRDRYILLAAWRAMLASAPEVKP